MPIFLKILLLIIIPVVWNLLTVYYLHHQHQKGKETPLKFAVFFSIGYSLTISAILLIAIFVTQGITPGSLYLVLFVFLLNLLIGFPIAYFLFKRFKEPIGNAMEKILAKKTK